MRTQLLIAVSALLACGVAAAQTRLPTIEVRAGTNESVMVPCGKPDAVTAKDVQRVLSIDDSRTTRGMRRQFISAVSDACKAGIPHILVTRSGSSLTWKKMQ
jgi:hypothetical protein